MSHDAQAVHTPATAMSVAISALEQLVSVSKVVLEDAKIKADPVAGRPVVVNAPFRADFDPSVYGYVADAEVFIEKLKKAIGFIQ